jgi:hypothetical protein
MNFPSVGLIRGIFYFFIFFFYHLLTEQTDKMEKGKVSYHAHHLSGNVGGGEHVTVHSQEQEPQYDAAPDGQMSQLKKTKQSQTNTLNTAAKSVLTQFVPTSSPAGCWEFHSVDQLRA